MPILWKLRHVKRAQMLADPTLRVKTKAEGKYKKLIFVLLLQRKLIAIPGALLFLQSAKPFIMGCLVFCPYYDRILENTAFQ